MAIESAVLFRRTARNACLVLAAAWLCGAAAAQLPIKAPVPVTVGSVVPFGHGSTGQWSQIYSLKVAHNRSVLFLDTAVSNLYQWAPGAAAPTLVVGPAPSGQSSNGSTLEASGSFWNSGMALDANDNLYITDRYGSAVHFFRVPYDAASGTWIFSQAANWVNSPSISLNGVPTAIEPQDLAINCDSGFPCTMYVAWSNSGEIDKFTIYASGNPGTVTRMITGMETSGNIVAADHAGNLFFLESVYSSPSSRVTGIREIVAGSAPIAGDSTGAAEQKLPRIDPAAAGFNFKGMTFDDAGNLFLSSENDNNAYGGQVDMVLMVPNEGTPAAPNLVWNDAVMVAPVAAGFPVAIDPRGYLWIPNGNGGSNWASIGTKAPPCTSVAPDECTTSGAVLWVPGAANLGASPVGTAGSTATVFYSFSQPTTPGSFTYAAAGAKNFTTIAANPNPDPTIVPPVNPCAAGTAYPAFAAQDTVASENSWCSFYVQLNPQTAGSIAGELQILDSSKSIVPGSNVYLNGVGQGPAISVLTPANAHPVALGLQSPKQVAGDAWGNSYVADSTLAAVEMYPPGQTSAVVGTALGTGLTAPTGVTVDGAGDVFIGDSGNIVEIPFINGALATKQQTALQTGLGKNLTLAADGGGNVFVADADNKQVVKVSNAQMGLLLENAPLDKIGAGVAFTGPSAIATDNAGNVYVADGSNLWELSPSGGSTEITSSLSAPVTGLAVDPSGSIFVVESTGLVWIPYDASTGGFNVNGLVHVATMLGNNAAPFSVALDGLENAYATYGAAATAGMSQVGSGGFINWGQIVPNLENDQEAQILNLGNSPLALSAFSGDIFTGANASDYLVGSPFDTPACSASTPISPGQGCFFDVALTPSNPSGTNSASLALLSNAANAPSLNIGLTANIVADLRSATTTSIAVTPPSGVVYPGSVSIAVTVAAVDSSKGTPTGTIALIMTGENIQTAQLANGVATFSFSGLLGGPKTIRAEYGGAGVAGTAPNFAGSASKTTIAVAQATPLVAVGPPAGGSGNVTVWAGNTYVNVATNTTIAATVTSKVGTPTGTVSFLQGGQPVDPSQAQISLDANGSDTLYVPTATLWNGIVDIAAVGLGNGELGSSPVGTPSATSAPVYYSFSGSVTPARFIIQENGVTTLDFAIVTGGSCAAGTAYPIPASSTGSAVTFCTLNVALNPQRVGSLSAQLLMQTSTTAGGTTTYTTVATTTLHGTGLARAIATSPAWETALDGKLKTPSQIATDNLGAFGPDALPLTAGLKAPSSVAVDSANNLYVIDGANLIKYSSGVQSTLLNNLSNATGVAVDASGAVAKSAISALSLPKNPASYLPYVLQQDGSTLYDGSADFWEYQFTVTVSAAVGQPTGIVTFKDGSSVACPQQSGQATQTLNPNGQATFATDCLPMPQNVTYTPVDSTHTITPYSGDANFIGFTGQPVTFQVVRGPALLIASAPASLSVAAGSSASANLTLTSILGYGFAGKNQQLNDYNFPVTLSCDNLPPHATCSFTYPNPDPSISTAVDIPCTGTTAAADDCAAGLATVTIDTNVPVGTTSQIAPRMPITLAVLFGFGMIGLFFRRRAAEKARLLLMLFMVILSGALGVSLTACSTTKLSPASILTTPSGTYAVTVTAQQVGSQVITLPTGPITIYGSQNQVSLPFTLNVTVK